MDWGVLTVRVEGERERVSCMERKEGMEEREGNGYVGCAGEVESSYCGESVKRERKESVGRGGEGRV